MKERGLCDAFAIMLFGVVLVFNTGCGKGRRDIMKRPETIPHLSRSEKEVVEKAEKTSRDFT